MPFAPQQAINQPAAQTQATLQTAPAPAYNFNYNPYMPGYGGYGGYGGFYPGRAGGYLYGVAAVTSANANAYGTYQEGRIVNQQANQSQLDTRRKIINESLYEQSLLPSEEDNRARDQAMALRRARNDPPPSEIWDGTALNVMVKAIEKGQQSGLRGPLVPLDPQTLRHLNLTGGTTPAGVGLFRDGGMLSWPLVLKSKTFAPERKKLDALAPRAVMEAMAGRINDETLESLVDTVDALRTKVDAAIVDLSPSQFISASRYVNELKTTVKSLQDPNVSKQFNGSWTAKGNSVSELTDQLLKQGLKIAPAAPGDEPYYTSLYNSLISYDLGLAQLAARYSGGK